MRRTPPAPYLRALALLVVSLALPGGACIERPPAPPPRDAAPALDASEPPRVIGVQVLDASDRAWDLDAMPRSPRIVVVASAPLGGAPDPIVLLAGEDDAALLDDLATPPLRASTLARAIPCARTTDGARVDLAPLAPLAPGARLVVAIGGWARDPSGRRIAAPFARALRVAQSATAGARAVETWPPDGAAAIGAALPIAGVRFDGEVRGIEDGLWIEGPDGAPISAHTRAARCDELGWPGDHCAAIVPARALAPGAPHAIRSGASLRDATGAGVPELRASFTTAREPDLEPPLLLGGACARDELETEIGCVLADDAHVEVRVRASEPARLRLDGGGLWASAVAPRGEATLALAPLAPGASFPATLAAIDAAGNARRVELALATTPPLAPIAITEVRADPYGAEPRQEYVEIENRGAVAIDLGGFSIADAPGSVGDVIAGPRLVPPGARALLVSDRFDPDDRGPGGADAPVPPGVILVRLDGSIASGGLSNSGEALFLRDPEGRRVSAAPAEPPPRQGVCTVRVASDPRTGARGSFDYDAEGGCTPGR